MSSPTLRDHTSGPLATWAARLERVAGIARRHGVPELAERAPHDCAGNVLWLLELDRRDAALDVLAGVGTLTDALRVHFGRVAAVDVAPGAVATLRERFDGTAGAPVEVRECTATALPFGDGEFDCVTLHDALDRVPAAARPALFRECRRVLRPGGALYLSAPNARWHRRLRRAEPQGAGSVVPGRTARSLRAAGFRETRLFYLEPSCAYPLAFVPATAAALLAFERRGRRRTAAARLREGFARVGLHPLLHHSVMLLATA